MQSRMPNINDIPGHRHLGDDRIITNGSRIWVGPDELILKGPNDTYLGSQKVTVNHGITSIGNEKMTRDGNTIYAGNKKLYK